MITRLKEAVSHHLAGSRAYGPVRGVYQNVFNRDYVRLQKAMRKFYRQFVAPGSLVFDVGANIGEHAAAFLDLGARVVAVEPNPECCNQIRARRSEGRLTVRCEAVGDHQGEVTLYTGTCSGHSTISEEWMRTASQNDPGFRWNGRIKVPLNTLNDIGRHHGIPDFIKIDVEGYEASVLREMSFRPAALCFEFHAYAVDGVRDCLSLPIFESASGLNLALADSWDLAWDSWRDKAAILAHIAQLPTQTFGDIYVRF